MSDIENVPDFMPPAPIEHEEPLTALQIDAFVGETFKSRDTRDPDRRIRITGFDEHRQKFVGRTLVAGKPTGRVTRISFKSLDDGKLWRKTSH